jgi:predicted Zn-dependent protease
MALQRFLIGLLVALLLQAGVFAWAQADLLYLRRPVDAIVADGVDTFERHASKALSRDRLTRYHLDTIADAAERLGRTEIAIEALTRRMKKDPADHHVTLRLADTLRRAGQLDRAEALYSEVLRASQDQSR